MTRTFLEENTHLDPVSIILAALGGLKSFNMKGELLLA